MPFRRLLTVSPPTLIVALVLAFLLTVGTALLGVFSTRGVLAANAQTARTQETVIAAQQLLFAITDAEAAQRGYILTAGERYLELYQHANDKLDSLLAHLRVHLKDLHAGEETIARLGPLIAAKKAEWAKAVRLRGSNYVGAALNVVEAEEGSRIMEELRAILVEIERDELAELASLSEVTARRTQDYQNASMAMIVLAVSLTLAASMGLYRRVRDLETMITVCAWTKRVKWKGRWVKFEEYLENRFNLRLTHGISEEAAEQFRTEANELEAEEARRTSPDQKP